MIINSCFLDDTWSIWISKRKRWAFLTLSTIDFTCFIAHFSWSNPPLMAGLKICRHLPLQKGCPTYNTKLSDRKPQVLDIWILWRSLHWLLSLRVFWDYCLHLYCYFHNILTDMSSGPLQVFVKLGNLNGTSNYVLLLIPRCSSVLIPLSITGHKC